MLASSGDRLPPVGAGDRVLHLPGLGEDAGLAERLDQPEHALVPDLSAHPRHERGVVEVVEACLDISFDRPLVAGGGEVVDLGERVVGAAARAEPYEHDLKSASKLGSSTSLSAAWTTRSWTSGGAGPSRRCQGCSRPFLGLQAAAALSLAVLLGQARRWSPFTSPRSSRASWRTFPAESPCRYAASAHPAGILGRCLSVRALRAMSLIC
jgi:hypothetical protein